MIPWSLLDSAKVPGGTVELRLLQRGPEFSIRLGTAELMNSRINGSEQALANLACQKISDRAAPQLLIGGLGMGFTLRAALAGVGTGARCTVCELVPAVIAWARGPMAQCFGSSLHDPRVAICEGDVAQLIRAGRASYDAILLDVDNGPTGLCRKANDRLYDSGGLAAARSALRPGGVLAVWSVAPDTKFTSRLCKAGFTIEEVRVRANGTARGARHMIWLATSAGAIPPAASRSATTA